MDLPIEVISVHIHLISELEAFENYLKKKEKHFRSLLLDFFNMGFNYNKFLFAIQKLKKPFKRKKQVSMSFMEKLQNMIQWLICNNVFNLCMQVPNYYN